jgi:hypothetical protein
MGITGLYIAGALLVLYGLMEASSIFFSGKHNNSTSHKLPKFIFETLQNNTALVYALGVVLGVLRIIAGIAIISNLMWGFALGIILCISTLILMTFYLPAGIADGIFTGIILIILLVTYYGGKTII